MMDDITHCRGLRRFELSGVWSMPGAWLNELSRLPVLEEVALTSCNYFSDADIAGLAEVNSLRHLDLSYSYKITPEGILALRHLPLLKIILAGLSRKKYWTEEVKTAIRDAWPEAEITYRLEW